MSEDVMLAIMSEEKKGDLDKVTLSSDTLQKYFPKSYTLNCTPFVRQYDILSNKWGVLLCQKEYQTNDIRRSSREWL